MPTTTPPASDAIRLAMASMRLSEAQAIIEEAAAILLVGVTEGAPEARDLYMAAWQRLTRWKDEGPVPAYIQCQSQWTGGSLDAPGSQSVLVWPVGWGPLLPPEML